MEQTIISQLEKIIKSKTKEEMVMRAEILLDVLTSNPIQPTQPTHPVSPVQPAPAFTPALTPVPNPTASTTRQVKGSGAIVDARSEQINYTRPEGT